MTRMHDENDGWRALDADITEQLPVHQPTAQLPAVAAAPRHEYPQPSQPAQPAQPAQSAQPIRTAGRGPGWLATGAMVLAGMALASGASIGGVIAYDQLLGGDAPGAPAPASSSSPAAPVAAKGEANWSDVAAAVSPSTVAIRVAEAAGTSQGTGIILDADGAILTNRHVVGHQSSAEVTLSDGRALHARIVGTDEATDLAVLRLDSPPKGLQPAVLGDSAKVAVGQDVMAVGSPLGLDNTVTTGIISAVNRPVTTTGESGSAADASFMSALQTDAAINPGNSGGPLVDASGRVIGINTAIAGMPSQDKQAGSIGLGFAIPVNTARMIGDQLLRDGSARHAFLGVTSRDGSAQLDGATRSGAEVVSVEPDSPAAATDLAAGDVITSVDGVPSTGAAALTGIIRGQEVGSAHRLSVVRDGRERALEVTLTAAP